MSDPSPAPQALNHSSQCLQFWRDTRMAQRFAERGDRSFAHALQCMTDVLWKAPKFLLPEGGRPCEDVGSIARMLTSARLPFPTLALEYSVGHNALVGREEVPSRRRIALVSEALPSYVTQDRAGDRPFGRSLFVQSICCVEDPQVGPTWTPVLGVAEVSLDAPPKTGKPGELSASGIDAEYLRLRAEHIEAYQAAKGLSLSFATQIWPFGDQLGDVFGGDRERMLSTLAADSNDEVLAAISFACLSACANVSMPTLAAPPKLNRKREQAGRVPLFDVRLLMVADSGAYLTKAAPEGGGTSTHASPRTHLRRGHIRMLEGSRSIWVNAAVVNAHRGAPLASSAPAAVPVPTYELQRPRA